MYLNLILKYTNTMKMLVINIEIVDSNAYRSVVFYYHAG